MITSFWEEMANFSAIVYLLFCGFRSDGFSFPLGAWDRLWYYIVALSGTSI